MGADMITTILWVELGTELKFEEARAKALALPMPEQNGGLFDILERLRPDDDVDDDMSDEAALALVRVALGDLVSKLEESLNSREVDYRSIGPVAFYVTGGMSYGDSPTELSDIVEDCNEVWEALDFDVLEEVGFVAAPGATGSQYVVVKVGA